MNSEQEDTAIRLQLLATRLLRLARSAHGKQGIGSAQYSALAVLYERGPISVVELARVERVAHPTMSRIVGGLEKLGAVERRMELQDRRQRQLVLTAPGRALYESISVNRVEAINTVLARMSAGAARELAEALAEAIRSMEQRD
ncbi:MarR family transcriptional regulator [Sphingobium yanoikuyae]|jgi:DNA-binding MarR family transcriptional regulator|uniref:MarR family transcriptional regulator n=1 Tax=Sphingobium yanoikuyae TaxID=13690 RepID=A0AA43BEE2_SPHYA|nr:MarR family transcriptional regulator [Sphingobium yanoikuyae]MDH2135285.1 MarR family transcriptional regulator [Sphingobium yanoikuyae]MDH2153503.1 MarR family transcriptional regulator [Sphingobium yanoikuyae]MDH2170638.1 MarR family transcriptional regulator [Sphingobium yanoikuyae]